MPKNLLPQDLDRAKRNLLKALRNDRTWFACRLVSGVKAVNVRGMTTPISSTAEVKTASNALRSAQKTYQKMFHHDCNAFATVYGKDCLKNTLQHRTRGY